MHFTEPLSSISTVQGQTLKKVGVWLLGSPCFTHGQLYVAASRVGHPDDLHFAIMKPTKKEELPFLTKNVVYREVLLPRRSVCLPFSSQATNIVSVGLGEEPTDMEHMGLFDGIPEEEWKEREDDAPTSRNEFIPKRKTLASMSIPLPPQVIEATLPTSQETEVSGSKHLS